MKLRNKKTGEIGKLHCDMNVTPAKYGVFEDADIRGHYWEYHSLAELNEEWEDYKPAEPLIKDEKVRKIVRAWADLYDNSTIRVYIDKEHVSLFNSESLNIDIPGNVFRELIDKHYYTIAELCGEEGE